MANRFVIFIKANTDVAANGTSDPFIWEVRELITDGTGSVLERSGPVIVRGSAETVVTAKHQAETWAETLAQETVYIYNTTTQEPTPLPSP